MTTTEQSQADANAWTDRAARKNVDAGGTDPARLQAGVLATMAQVRAHRLESRDDTTSVLGLLTELRDVMIEVRDLLTPPV